MDILVNKVAESGIITLDLSLYLPLDDSMLGFDLQPYLFRGLILKEKDYREALKQQDWGQYSQKHVYLYCSTDAIIPMWAYMLAASYLQPVAKSVFFGTRADCYQNLLLQNIAAIDAQEYQDKRVVLKGCGDIDVPAQAYVAVTATLQPVVKSLMYGEPCSTVPVYKKRI